MGDAPAAQALICAFDLDGHGGGRPLAFPDLDAPLPEEGFRWVHLDYTMAESRRWLAERSGVEEVTAAALAAEETRPRAVGGRDGLLVVLRGVNMNPGSDPEDMVSIRVWVEGRRVITTRQRRLLAVQDIREAIAAGDGPATPGEFLVTLCERLADRISTVLQDVEEAVDALEEDVLVEQTHALTPRLAAMRRQAILLRRYLAPQREALARLQGEKVPGLSDLDRLRLREVADRSARYLEDLDAARERAAVAQEELESRLSALMDRRMYLLSMVAAVFLPLGFVTGLLGVNVGGVPGEGVGWAFLVLCLLLVVLTGGMLLYFRRRRWL